MSTSISPESLGCEYCRKQSRFWWKNEWRYVDLIGATSAHCEVGRCPKCGTYYRYGAETWGRPVFVRSHEVTEILEAVKNYGSAHRND